MKKKNSAGADFDPNSPASGNTLFGLPFEPNNANIIIMPAPWEVTVSYRTGAAKGPEAILQASKQVDLYDLDLKDCWKAGVAMVKSSEKWKKSGKKLRREASVYIDWLTSGKPKNNQKIFRKILKEVNDGSAEFAEWLCAETNAYLDSGKLVCLLGGDHSTPFGFIKAVGEKHGEIGILHIDAHADLRVAYEDFIFSHASIMFNVSQLPQVKKIVSVGIRDICEEEINYWKSKSGQIDLFFDRDIAKRKFHGETWSTIVKEIVKNLPPKVYVSFDIDGLDPTLCPNTGTPVPGGLQFEEACFLIEEVINSGRRIVGFDLVEVAPGKDEWDANVGARLLLRLINYLAQSNGLLKSQRAV